MLNYLDIQDHISFSQTFGFLRAKLIPKRTCGGVKMLGCFTVYLVAHKFS